MNFLHQRYPKAVLGKILLRPMNASDEAALVSFFKRIPIDERQLFREDVTRLSAIQAWIKNLDYGRILPILAFQGSRIVADASLHRDQGGWSRHLGKVRLTLDPEFRRQGLARLLMQEFIDLSKSLGIAILEAEILDVQKKAASLFEEMGFLSSCTVSVPPDCGLWCTTPTRSSARVQRPAC